MALTIKMRAGFKEPNASTIAQLLCDLGVDALAIHPRLQTQKFGGQLDLSIVKEIKESVTIPVLYSGGIHTFADAKTVYEQTGVDGFLIGRALLGQPWKLAQLSAHATGKEFTISRAHIMRTAAHHFERMCLTYGARSLYAFRKHAHYYIRGFTDGNELKHAFFSATSVEQVKELLQRHAGDCQ